MLPGKRLKTVPLGESGYRKEASGPEKKLVGQKKRKVKSYKKID